MKVYFQIPYYNEHITIIFKHLHQDPDIDLKIGLLYPGNKFRPGYDRDEFIDKDLYIKIWKERKLVSSFVKSAHVLGVHGIFCFHKNYILARRAIKNRKKLLLFSEGLKPKSILHELYRKVLIKRINSNKVSFLGLGQNAFEDYLQRGAICWHSTEYGYSVQPNYRVNINHKGKLKLVFVGQLIKRKRLDLLLHALDQLDSQDFTLNIYGDGPEYKNLKQLSVAKQFNANVKFNGLISKEDLFEELVHHDCLVLPSDYDGWGAVVNEAMEAGLAVIVSNGVRAQKLVQKQFIFNRGDSSQLSEIIHKLQYDRPLLNSIKKRNKKEVEKFRPSKMAEQIKSLIFECLPQ